MGISPLSTGGLAGVWGLHTNWRELIKYDRWKDVSNEEEMVKKLSYWQCPFVEIWGTIREFFTGLSQEGPINIMVKRIGSNWSKQNTGLTRTSATFYKHMEKRNVFPSL